HTPRVASATSLAQTPKSTSRLRSDSTKARDARTRTRIHVPLRSRPSSTEAEVDFDDMGRNYHASRGAASSRERGTGVAVGRRFRTTIAAEVSATAQRKSAGLP